MRRMWIALALLALLLGAGLFNSCYLDRLTDHCRASLDQATHLARLGHWAGATLAAEQAAGLWWDHDSYLHVTLPHRDIDAIRLSFGELEQALAHQQSAAFTVAAARLRTQLSLLSEMEQLNGKNIF